MKTLIMTAALCAACVATSVAQTVYSVNAVGYVNVTVPASGFAILANPLNQPTNSLAAVLPDAPVNTVVYIFDAATQSFSLATKRTTGWTGTGASAMLDPGKGFFIKNPNATDMTLTFVGEVPQGENLSVSFPAGFSLLGSIVPQAGTLETDLKFPAAQNDKAYIFNAATQSYTVLTRRASAWTGGTGEPAVAVAQGLFYQAVTAGSWTRSFSVNQ
jgi:hypothetical protein